MSTTTRRQAPAQFHRRLWLLAMAIGLIMVILIAQTVRLTVIQGEAHHALAASRLMTSQWLPTWRGTIRDRHGVILAQDVPRWEAAVAFDAITGQWAEDRAIRDARQAMGREAWSMASPEVRAASIAAARDAHDAVLRSMWSLLAEVGGMEESRLSDALDDTRGRVQRMTAVVWDQQRRRHDARFGPGHESEFVPRPIREQEGDHVLLRDLDDHQAASLQGFADRHPELLSLRYARQREHPVELTEVKIDRSELPAPLRQQASESIQVMTPASSIIGEVRDQVWQEDVARRPFRRADGAIDRGGYRADDVVGASGIEWAAEDTLRGQVGLISRDRDQGQISREPPVGGADVMLTIDVMLQSRIEAILDPALGLTVAQPWHGGDQLPQGTPLPASVVVLDIPTGEVMAMAGTPTTADLPTMSKADSMALNPWLLRAVQVAAPPGSIVKPLVLVAAMGAGLVDVDTVIECRGHHFPNQPDIARCWIHRPEYGMAKHGPLGVREALARSCNCWFYELGAQAGLAAMVEWLSAFGLGQTHLIGLTAPDAEGSIEVPGMRPDQDLIEMLRARGEDTFESLMMAIGQGRSAWTPLHAADAYATLVRGGHRVAPVLVRGFTPPDSPSGPTLPSAAVEVVIAGLEDVIAQPWGSAHHHPFPDGPAPIFTVSGVKLAAKTGTAQAPPWKRDRDGDGDVESDEQIAGLKHAWIVVLVGDLHGPWRYSIAVLLEYGGSGGRAAGPIANQVIHALQHHGYLNGGGTE